MKLVFYIEVPPEEAAGMIGCNDTVTIQVESGNPGGEDGEFTEYMKDVLKEWYDTPRVILWEKEADNEK